MPTLRDGTEVSDPRLGRIYEQDLRSLNFLVRTALPPKAERKPRGFTWSVGQWLDQGQEGACVGFGYSHDLIARPVQVAGISDAFAREKVYWQAQREDPYEGGAYPGAAPFSEGTSVLTGAKVVTDLGFYNSYRWALTGQEVASGIGYDGPCILGLNWWTNMFEPDANGFLRPTGQIEGGHCLLAYAVKIVYRPLFGWFFRTWDQVNFDASYIRVWNSWGPTWGDQGTAKISLTDMKQLIEGEQGEACFPVRNPLKTAA